MYCNYGIEISKLQKHTYMTINFTDAHTAYWLHTWTIEITNVQTDHWTIKITKAHMDY